jgi:excisionase family DNA binding protein
MQKPKYYSPEEVAEIFRVNAETIRKMCKDGKIPGARQIGRLWRIPAEWVENNPDINEDDEQKD